MQTKAIILSAGFGKRLLPLTETTPKPLLPIAGIPIIRRTINNLASFGIKEIVINLHHLADEIKRALTTPPPGIKIHFTEEAEILGTAGGIKGAQHILGGGDFIVINSDIIAEIDFKDLIKQHKEKEALATMVLRQDPDVEKYGPIETDNNGKIRRLLNKPDLDNNIQLAKYMFTGVQVMSPRFLERIPKTGYSDISKDIYPKLVAAEEGLYGYVTKGYWTDIGTPETYLRANFRELAKSSESFPNRKGITPPVYIGKDCQIGENVKIGPNCLIGNNCSIKSGAKISETVIMDGTTIGAGAEVISSVIGNNVSIETNSQIFKKIIAVKGGNTTSHSY
ncbi:MAG: NDP-sugar synthase [Nitrospinae bacterium]|nr:NDP-sugar synthase [Nitrospinota bacterium]